MGRRNREAPRHSIRDNDKTDMKIMVDDHDDGSPKNIIPIFCSAPIANAHDNPWKSSDQIPVPPSLSTGLVGNEAVPEPVALPGFFLACSSCFSASMVLT